VTVGKSCSFFLLLLYCWLLSLLLRFLQEALIVGIIALLTPFILDLGLSDYSWTTLDW
jgi:hypothetical protein